MGSGGRAPCMMRRPHRLRRDILTPAGSGGGVSGWRSSLGLSALPRTSQSRLIKCLPSRPQNSGPDHHAFLRGKTLGASAWLQGRVQNRIPCRFCKKIRLGSSRFWLEAIGRIL